MNRRKQIVIAAIVLAVAGTGAGVAVATSDTDTPIRTSSDRERAGKAALDHVGEGRVTETEEGDEESYYEVEVTREDGRQVDVQLDRNFKVVGQEEDADEDGEDES